jgi:hypothetical protein
MALHPVIDLVRRSFEIEDGDPEPAIAERIDRGLMALGEAPEVARALRVSRTSRRSCAWGRLAEAAT